MRGLSLFMGIFLAGAVLWPLNAQDDSMKANLADSSAPKQSVELYPNPASDFITLTLPARTAQPVEIEVFNIIGNKIRAEVEEIGDRQFKISVKELNPGYYLVVVRDARTRSSQAMKFQKK